MCRDAARPHRQCCRGWPLLRRDMAATAPRRSPAAAAAVLRGPATSAVRRGGIMPGGEMKIVRESPTSAIVRFKAGSVEPAHHHTFEHDLVVMKGKKKVWNLTKKESYDLEDGDFLFMPAGNVHRVRYFTDTEFFIRWDGDWDIFLDEDLEAAKEAIDKELAGSVK